MDPTEQTAPPTFVARLDKRKLYLMAAGAIAGYAALFYFVGNVQRGILGFVVVVAVGYALKEAFTNNTKVVIDRSGVFDSRLNVGTIRWQDITGVSVEELQHFDVVCLELANEEKYLKKRSSMTNAAMKYNEKMNKLSQFQINPSVLDASANEIYYAITRGREYYSAAANASEAAPTA
jgi:hypothetical protein